MNDTDEGESILSYIDLYYFCFFTQIKAQQTHISNPSKSLKVQYESQL